MHLTSKELLDSLKDLSVVGLLCDLRAKLSVNDLVVLVDDNDSTGVESLQRARSHLESVGEASTECGKLLKSSGCLTATSEDERKVSRDIDDDDSLIAEFLSLLCKADSRKGTDRSVKRRCDREHLDLSLIGSKSLVRKISSSELEIRGCSANSGDGALKSDRSALESSGHYISFNRSVKTQKEK